MINLDYFNKLNNMENYIYLCWINLFAITFSQINDYEKPFRFYQMLDVLKRAYYIDVGYIKLARYC